MHPSVDFYVQNELKPTYGHLSVQIISRGLYPRTPKRRERKSRDGTGRKEMRGRDRTE